MADKTPSEVLGAKPRFTLHELAHTVLSSDLQALLPASEAPEKGTVEYHMYMQTLLLVEICSNLNVMRKTFESSVEENK